MEDNNTENESILINGTNDLEENDYKRYNNFRHQTIRHNQKADSVDNKNHKKDKKEDKIEAKNEKKKMFLIINQKK